MAYLLPFTPPAAFTGRPLYLQDVAEDDWILKTELDPAIRAIQDLGLRFDALIKPRHILNAVKFIEHYPNLPVIVDHMAKPDIASGAFEP